MKYPQTKQRLFELLQAGHRVSVHWDCGGDESFVTTSIDGQQQTSTYEPGNFAYEVEWLLTEELELPSAGEFSMSGDGQFYLEGRSVGLEYQSEAEVYEEDFDEEDYYNFLDAQQAATDPARPAPIGEAAGTPPQQEKPDEADQAAVRDQEMSEEYSGRRILFNLPD